MAGQVVREVFFAFEHLRPHAADLHGRTLTRVETRGKAMLSWFDDEVAVYSHNQLYGRWFVRKRGGLARTNRTLRFAVHTDRGSALLYSASEIAVLAQDELGEHPFLRKLGPDPLDPSTTSAILVRRMQDRRFCRRQLAGLLLDQQFVAGLGNYLRSEILFTAGLSPSLRPTDLDRDAQRLLARKINLVTRRAYRTGGITADAATASAAKRAGEARRRFRHYVFSRAGQPCRHCETPVVKRELAGRRLYLCPSCQSV